MKLRRSICSSLLFCRDAIGSGRIGQHNGSRRFHGRKGRRLAAALCHRHDPPMADVALATKTETEPRWRVVWRNVFPFLVLATIWELVARLGFFPPRLFPSIEAIAAAFWRLTLNGILPHHALDTVIRLGVGFALAAVVGVGIGIAM